MKPNLKESLYKPTLTKTILLSHYIVNIINFKHMTFNINRFIITLSELQELLYI